MRERMTKVPVNHLVARLRENKMHISELSITKYNKITNHRALKTLHAMPDLSNSENGLNHRTDLPFLSFEEIKKLNQNLLRQMEEVYVHAQEEQFDLLNQSLFR
jgi:hypothetical protein